MFVLNKLSESESESDTAKIWHKNKTCQKI